MKKLPFVILALVCALSVTANFLLFNRYSARRPIVRVGDEVIIRKDYQDAIDYEYGYGKQVLTKMVLERLVRQAARKAGLAPTQKDVDARIADIERRMPAVLEEAKKNPARMYTLRRDIETDIALENLRIRDVKLSDAEARAFYRKNRTLFTLPAQAQTMVVISPSRIDAATAEDLLRRDTRPDVIARQPRLRVVGVGGFAVDWQRLPPDTAQRLSQAVFRLKPGEVVSVPVGGMFVTMRVNRQSGAGTPAFEAVKDRVVRMAKLQKAPSAEKVMAKLYRDGNVTVEVGRYNGFFSDLENTIKQLDEKSPEK